MEMIELLELSDLKVRFDLGMVTDRFGPILCPEFIVSKIIFLAMN